MTVAAIVVAAGSGSRLGASVPKAFVPVAGRTLLEHAVAGLRRHPRIGPVVIAVPPGWVERARELLPEALVVGGGATRQRSVALALDAVPPDADLVLVHDAARAFVPGEVISRVVEALDAGATAVVPALPVSDTIRSVDPACGQLGGLVDRSRLLAMQTPQGFRRDVLVRAHSVAAVGDSGDDATDDAALAEAIGVTVVAVRGDKRACKITVPLDLALAEVLVDG